MLYLLHQVSRMQGYILFKKGGRNSLAEDVEMVEKGGKK
jgi:hypothetical protein